MEILISYMVFHRIIVLAAMGLGAMYMMHLLAQDFQRIRRPIQNAVRSFIYKRDVMAATQAGVLRPPLHYPHEPVTVNGHAASFNCLSIDGAN